MAKGKKTGGRKRGTPNKATAERQAVIAASGLTPLEYMLQVMRDEDQGLDVRLEAAKYAAPYVHPKLASIEHKGDSETPLQIIVKSYDGAGRPAE